jgi:hypothetical protein
MLCFQRPNEFACVGEKLSSGHRKFLSQGIRNLIDGTPLLQQVPDSEPDRVETETNALLNIQKHRPIFGCSLPDAWRNHEVWDLCWLAHVAALRQNRAILSSNTGQDNLGFWMPAKNYFCCKNLRNEELRAR